MNSGPSERTSGSRLRALLAAEGPVVAPGAMNPLFARLIEQAGFDSVYLTGSGVATGMLGVPDLGLTTLTEMSKAVEDMAEAVSIPIVADGDTGYGGTLNVERAVRLYERSGAAAIQLEDQVNPKRCGHFEGKQVVPLAEMMVRLRAALAARRDPSFVIIARTDACSVLGLDEAIRRGLAFAREGADMVFVESPRDDGELIRIGAELKGVPLMVNMVEGGATPLHSAAELGAFGFKLVIFPGLLTRVVTRAAIETLAELRLTGDSRPLLDGLLNLDDLQAVLGLERINRHVAGLERDATTAESSVE